MTTNGSSEGLIADLWKQYVEEQHGFYRIALKGSRCSIFGSILDRTVPCVVINAYRPHDLVEWWDCAVPLRKGGPPRKVQVRSMCFDLQVSLADFIMYLPDFEDLGIDVFQSAQPVPNMLCIERLREGTTMEVLAQNGVSARFFLPHPGEIAIFYSRNRPHLESVLREPEIRKHLLRA